MGDLTEAQASGSTKIIGSDSSGSESNYAEVTPNNDLSSVDIQNTSYVSGKLTVTSSETQARVGASPLANRKELYIENIGNKDVFIGPTGVSATGANQGRLLESGSFVTLPYGENINVFLIVQSGSSSVIVQETA